MFRMHGFLLYNGTVVARFGGCERKSCRDRPERRQHARPWAYSRCYYRPISPLHDWPELKISPTPLTAALAGVFSALAWPLLWSRFGGGQSPGTFEVVIITLLVIALPAHAFVVGFGPRQAAGAGKLDTDLLKRVGAWLAAAGVTLLASTALTS